MSDERSIEEILSDYLRSVVQVCREDGLDGHLPMITNFDLDEFVVVSGIPENVDDRIAVQEMVERTGWSDSTLCILVQTARDALTVAAISRSGSCFAVVRQSGSEFSIENCERPEWWSLDLS